MYFVSAIMQDLIIADYLENLFKVVRDRPSRLTIINTKVNRSSDQGISFYILDSQLA